MARLIYSSITSLDGYTVESNGNFDWGTPDEEVHAFVNDLQRPIGTYLYGSALYDVMRYWETLDLTDEPEVARDYTALWKAAEKVVYSATLEAPLTERTRIERVFDAAAVRRMVDTAPSDVLVGGAHLAATAIRAGIVDEFHQFVSPVVVGNGTRFFPDDVHIELELLDERRFTNGTVYLRYARG